MSIDAEANTEPAVETEQLVAYLESGLADR